PSITPARIERSCVIAVTGQQNGLHATAARTFHFQQPDAGARGDHAVACQIVAALAATARPRTLLADVLEAGRSVAQLSDREPEWFRGPTGHVTGWLPIEREITPTLTYHFEADWSVVWQAGVGTAVVADTWLVRDPPVCVTKPESWPAQRIKVGRATID